MDVRHNTPTIPLGIPGCLERDVAARPPRSAPDGADRTGLRHDLSGADRRLLPAPAGIGRAQPSGARIDADLPAVHVFMQGCIAALLWRMRSEIFPLRLRGFATGTTVFGTWPANFVVTLTFPPLIDAVGGTTVLISAAANVATFVFHLRTIPETRRRSMEAVAAHLRQFAN
ncbi:MFS transporter [Streptomyces sp. NBC_00988]|uniref:MFS transporter n=1 Tax=Streptomyces sp. NBC_00988 TaxID=2903704 RepID=UPI00386BA2E5|nr:MFS transporter [Streptomyces sp. NBC_00988]